MHQPLPTTTGHARHTEASGSLPAKPIAVSLQGVGVADFAGGSLVHNSVWISRRLRNGRVQHSTNAD